MIDVLVTGRSLPALQVALDCAEVGLQVGLLTHTATQHRPDTPERDPEGVIAAFIERTLQPLDGHSNRFEGSENRSVAVRQVTETAPSSPLLRDRNGEWAAQPNPNVFGVPAVVLSAETLRLLGTGAALRAYLDRITPLLTVGKTRTLGELVQKRLGPELLRKLVQPQVFQRFGRSTDQVDVAIAAPGLNEALSRTGALSSAVLAYSDRHVKRETGVAPATGWGDLTQQLLRKLELYGVDLLAQKLQRIEREADSWVSELTDGTRVQSRAIVVDHASEPLPIQAQVEWISEVLPQFVRMHAETDMQHSQSLPPQSVTLCTKGEWALEIHTSETGTARAHLSSVAAPVGVHKPEQVADAFAQFQVEPSSDDGVMAWLTAAPFSSLAERDIAMQLLDDFVEHTPTMLPVGRVFHGDQLDQALEWSHAEAVKLRRKLLGIDGDPE